MTEIKKPREKRKLVFHSTNILLNESSRINSMFLTETAKLIDQPGEGTITGLTECFKDHVFFLSVHKRVVNEKQIRDDIETLGGCLESFFGQDVTCVLTDEAVFPQANKNCDKTDKPSTSNPGSMLISARSRNLATLAPNLKQSCPKTSVINIFNNAKQWGQAIWKIEYFTHLVKQIVAKIKSHSKQSSSKSKNTLGNATRPNPKSSRYPKPDVMSEKTKVMYLQKYFLKVESAKRNKFPLYKNLPFYPNIEISNATKNGSPFNDKFDKIKKDKPSFLHSSSETSNKLISRGKTSNTITKTKKRQIGHRFYCQCCNTNFSSYERHTKGPRHQAFVKKKENFQCVYDVLKEFNVKSELRDYSVEIQEDSSTSFYSDESFTDFKEELTRKRPCKALSSLSSEVLMPNGVVQDQEYSGHQIETQSNFKINNNCDEYVSNFNPNLVYDCRSTNSVFKYESVEAETAVNYLLDLNNGTKFALSENQNSPSKFGSNFAQNDEVSKSLYDTVHLNTETNLSLVHSALTPNLSSYIAQNVSLVNQIDPVQPNLIDINHSQSLNQNYFSVKCNSSNLDKPVFNHLDEPFSTKLEDPNIALEEIHEPNLVNNVLGQFLKQDEFDGDRVSQMLEILKESVDKTNLESTKVPDNEEPMTSQFDDSKLTLPYENNHRDFFCSQDSNDSLSRLNIDRVVNRVLDDKCFLED